MSDASQIPLAIIGMACRLPGADSLDEYWQLIRTGGSAIGELPEERFPRDLYYDPEKGKRAKSYSSIGAIVSDRPLDVELPLPADLLASSDKAHLELCAVAAAACRHAGLDPFHLPLRRGGVYVGHTRGSGRGGDMVYAALVEHTAQYLRQIEAFDQLVGGQTDAVIEELVQSVRGGAESPAGGPGPDLTAHQAARLVSMVLGLDGPYMAINAACASSLMALAMAGRALRLGQIDLALVGSASHCRFDSLVLFSKAQSVTATGSRPFDADADGLVTAEGYVALLVKTLDRAVADGDPIQAVIRGIGVASDGRGKSLWAPRKEGQIEAVRRAYQGGVDVARLQYIEAHATSTQVGDATELGALSEALQDRLPPGKRIPVGSVKANIGHTLETAGLAGLVKTVLAMQHRVIPPAINVRNLNPHIDWQQAPLFVPTETMPWPDPEAGQPRRAAVNAFGIGGLNAHVVLDEYVPGTAAALPAVSPASGLAQADSAIAVIGMASIYPGAQSVEEYWDLLCSGRDPKSEVPPDRWDPRIAYHPERRDLWHSPCKRGGFITDFAYDWRRHKVAPKQIANADPLQFMLLEAVDQAFHDAGYDQKTLPRQRTAVVVGTIFASDFANQLQMGFRLPDFQSRLARALRQRGVPDDRIQQVAEQYGDVLLAHMPALEDETGSFTTSTLASRITKTFDLMGGALALDAGGASAMAALSTSIDALRTGECDVVVCAAGQRSMGLPVYARLSLAGLLSGGQPAHPLDGDNDGLLPAEGVGVLVLKRLADAHRDGDKVRAIVRGIGAGRGDCLGSALQVAVQRGLESAGVEPRDVSLVETAAIGSPTAIRQEVQAVEAAYATGRSGPLLLDAVTGQLGYLFGGSGMAAFQKAALSLDRREVPAGQPVRKPLDGLALPLQTLTENAPLPVYSPEGRLFAAVDSCNNPDLAFHVVLERGQKVEPPVQQPAVRVEPRPAGPPAAWRIVRIGAASRRDLLDAAEQCCRDCEGWFARGGERFTAEERWRLAFVVSDPADLKEKAERALEQLRAAKSPLLPASPGAYWGQCSEQRPLVALLFPGQASQYGGMLQPLTEQYDPAGEALRHMEEVLEQLGYPRFAEMAWQDSRDLGVDVWRTQLSMLIADAVMYAALTAAGLRPDRISGHSYGEFPALLAAGAWTFDAAARATRARCEAITASSLARGRMVGTSAPAQLVEELCRSIAGRVYVSNYNSPRQTIAAGEEQALDALAEQLKQAGYSTRVLAVPRPFHTPLMDEVKEPLGRALREIPIGPPRIPLLSSVTNRYVAEPDDIRRNLVEQMTRPVRYTEQIERLAGEGVKVFVEVGPDRVLSQLNRQILSGRDVTILAADERRGGGLECLLHVRACLETLGAIGSEAPFDAPPAAAAAPAGGNGSSGAGSRRPAAAKAAESHQRDNGAGLPLLRLTGSPYEMGLQQGRHHQAAIRTILRRCADLAGMTADHLPALEPALDYVDDFFDPEDLEELRGIADGAGVCWENVLAHNLRVYPDLQAGCAHFAWTAEHGGSEGMLHGANEDLPLALTLRDCLPRDVQLRVPTEGFPYVTFGIPGQAGGINGVNAAGLGVTSAMLLDLPRREDTARGRLHACLVKRILQRAGDVDAAVEIVRSRPGTGAWGLCLSHHSRDRLCYLEYDGQRVEVQWQPSVVLAANHSQLHSSLAPVPDHSRRRLERLMQLVGDPSSGAMTIEQAQAALQDRFDGRLGRLVTHATMNTVRRVDNQLSLLIQASAGRMWVTAGPASPGASGRYYALELAELFGGESRIVVRRNGRAARERAPQPPAKQPPAKQTAAKQTAAKQTAAKQTAAKQTAAKQTAVAARPAPAVISPAAFAEATSRPGGPAAETGERVCHRFLCRMLEQPLPAGEPRLDGGALIVGDNPIARALLRRIEQEGRQALLLPANQPVEAALAALEDHWRSGPLPHVFLTTPHDPDAATSGDLTAWQTRRCRGVQLPYWVVQRWVQLLGEGGLLPGATLVACTALGGDFGFSGGVRAAEGGALTGLIKALRRELSTPQAPFRAKAVDTCGQRPPEEIAAEIWSETAQWQEVEVGYSQGRRLVVRPIPYPLDPLGDEAIPCGGTWLITGGARGVTAAVALELGRRYGLRMHLVGSSPLPQVDSSWGQLPAEGLQELRRQTMRQAAASGRAPAEAWAAVEKGLEIDRNLRAFAEAGIPITYHACDVSDRQRLAELLKQIRAVDGPIDGIVHGAGFERACRFEKKKRDLVERTIAAKVDAAAHLMDLTRPDPLRFFLAFGSISGRFGGNGQTDYCLANDMLAKLVQWYRTVRPDCRSALFHWHAWDEVGMAVRPESMHLKTLFRLQYMPPREGVEHLVNELRAGLPEGEVVISDWSHCQRATPQPAPAAAAGSPSSASAAEARPENPAPSPPPDSPPQVAPRHVLRLQACPRPRSAPPLSGPAIIVGEPGEARALQQEILSAGAAATVLPWDAGEARALELLDQAWAKQPLPHLFLVASRQPLDAAALGQSLHQRIRLPFVLAQRWIQLLDSWSGPATLVGVTGLGGDFGFAQPAAAPDGGALAGWLKSLHVENGRHGRHRLLVKVIDFPAGETASTWARSVLEELSVGPPDVEVAYRDGQRYTVQAQQQPPLVHAPAIRRDGTWVVTGGARGITARCALELGRRFGLKLHLLGRQQPPAADHPAQALSPEQLSQLKKEVTRQALARGEHPGRMWESLQKDLEIARNLQAYSEAGVRATYHACDITDRQALAQTLEGIRRQDGPIDGILHGAGVRIPARFERARTVDLDATIALKAEATLALMELTRSDPVTHFLGFSSISGRFGANGRAVYAMGNEVLAKLASWWRGQRPDCRATAFHWHGWAELGMMTQAVNFGAEALVGDLMPVAEGVGHLLAEVDAGLPEAEVLFTDGRFHRDHYPADLVVGPPPPRESQRPPEPLPLLDRVSDHQAGQRLVAESVLNPAAEPFLLQHRFRDRPLLPIVIAAEMLGEAAARLCPDRVVAGMDNLEILSGLRFFTDQPVMAKVRCQRQGEQVAAELSSDFFNRRGQLVQADRLHVRAAVQTVEHPLQLAAPPLQGPPGWGEVWYPPEQEEVLYHGPAFRQLQAISLHEQGGWGRVVASGLEELAGRRGAQGWLSNPATLDACLFACGIFLWFYQGRAVAIPQIVRRLRWAGRPQAGEACVLRFLYRGQRDGRAAFDFLLYGQEGAVLMQVEGFEAAVVAGRGS